MPFGWAAAASAAVGATASIYGSQQQAGAAKDAAGTMADAYGQAGRTTVAAGRDALNYLDPFRQMGLNAGQSLQDAMYSPQQRLSQMDSQRVQLEGEVSRLKSLAPNWSTYQILTGKNASERRASMFTEENQVAQQKISEAQSKLDTFNKQYETTKAQLAQPAPKIQESEWYKFRADLLNRGMDRSMAAQGLTGSGAALEERRMGLIGLGAMETKDQFDRLFGIYNTGANAATAGAGAITGTAQQLANQQIGAGQSQAQGYMGVAGANASMVNGISNSVTGAVGTGLQASQFQKLIDQNERYLNRNNGTTPTTTASSGTIANDAMTG